MVDTTHDHLRGGERQRPRADEIHLHRRPSRTGLWPWLLIGSIAILALWALLARNRSAQQAVGNECATTVEFAASSAIVPTQNRGGVEKLARCLKSDSDLRVTLQGHASPTELQGNASLPRERAEGLARTLASLGVAPVQYSVVPGGALCTETTDECARRNRAVSVSPT